MSENNLWELFLSFHHVRPGDGPLVTRLGDKRVCQLSHLTNLGKNYDYNLICEAPRVTRDARSIIPGVPQFQAPDIFRECL